MKTKQELVKEWLNSAEKDLLTATHELSFENDAVTESICFHCQQAAEKFIKAYMVFLDVEVMRTHEIGELISKCEAKDKEIAKFKDEADKLTDYAVEIRYPEAPERPEMDETKEAFKIAKAIGDFVKARTIQR